MFEVINIGDSRESPDPLSGIEPIEGEDAEQQTTYEWKRIDRSE